MTATTRKGDIVAVEVGHTVSYANPGKGRPTAYTTWHLNEVASATREGIAKTLRSAWGSTGPVRPHERVFTISPENQKAARRVFEAQEVGSYWQNLDALREVIRNQA